MLSRMLSVLGRVLPILGISPLTASARPSPVSKVSESDTSPYLFGPSIVEVSPGLRAVFPAKNFNRNVTTNWWQTEILDETQSELASEFMQRLDNASFLVFHKSMYSLLDIEDYHVEKSIETIFTFPAGPSFASRLVHDGTVYAPECNCVFFAELHPPKKGYSTDAMPWVWRVNLNDDDPLVEQVYPYPQLTVANGAYYHNGSVYWAQEGNFTEPGGIVKMDPVTLETNIVMNNYLGHRFNSPNDVVITRDGKAFFTDGYYGYDNFNDTLEPELANGVWRWDMQTGDIRQVAGAGGGPFTNPNGLALNLQEDKLYVTNRGNVSDNPAGGRTIYEFELHSDGLPLRAGNVFSYADAGFPDGIKLDRNGWVFAGVTGGVSVYCPSGELMGLIKVSSGDVAVNMQWVNDWLYIVGRDHLYRLQLNSSGVNMYD